MTTRKTLILAVIGASWLPHIALAHELKQGDLADPYEDNVAASPATCLCWRSSDWTPSRVVASCDPVALKAELLAANKIAAATPRQKLAIPTAPAVANGAPRVAVPRSVSVSVDASSAFDKSVLGADDKALRDGFARQMGDARY